MNDRELQRQIEQNLGLDRGSIQRMAARPAHGIYPASEPDNDPILRELGVSSADMDAYQDRRRALMAAERRADAITEQMNRKRVAGMPSGGTWRGPLGTAPTGGTVTSPRPEPTPGARAVHEEDFPGGPAVQAVLI